MRRVRSGVVRFRSARIASRRVTRGLGRVGPGAAALVLAIVTGACSRQSDRVIAPTPSEPVVTGMRWVWEPTALATAVNRAGANPLVQRALTESRIAGMHARHDLAIRAVGTGPDGNPIGLTLLPYSVGEDLTKAVFVSSVQGFSTEAVEIVEMIAGREPRANEIGFEPVLLAGRVVWVHTIDTYVPAPANPHDSGPVDPWYPPVQQSPMRRSFVKLFGCLAERMPQGCAAGAEIAEHIAPGIPRAAAIGCGVGAAIGAGSCVADFARSR